MQIMRTGGKNLTNVGTYTEWRVQIEDLSHALFLKLDVNKNPKFLYVGQVLLTFV